MAEKIDPLVKKVINRTVTNVMDQKHKNNPVFEENF